MDYVIFKSDGSIQKIEISRYIMQGSANVDKVFITFPNASLSYGCLAIFTLPNRQLVTLATTYKANYPYEADDPENPGSDYDGETANGYVVTLTQAVTLYDGLLVCAIQKVDAGDTTDIIQTMYPFTLVVNETGIRPDNDTGVTLEQLDTYVAQLAALGSAIAGKANDSEVVHKSGNETITGNKAFTGSSTFTGAATFTGGETHNGTETHYGIVGIDSTFISTNNAASFVRVGTQANQYIYYDLPFTYSDFSEEKHLKLAVTDAAQQFTAIQTFKNEVRFYGEPDASINVRFSNAYLRPGVAARDPFFILGLINEVTYAFPYDSSDTGGEGKAFFLATTEDVGTKLYKHTIANLTSTSSYEQIVIISLSPTPAVLNVGTGVFNPAALSPENRVKGYVIGQDHEILRTFQTAGDKLKATVVGDTLYVEIFTWSASTTDTVTEL